jgi:hypothetical protein
MYRYLVLAALLCGSVTAPAATLQQLSTAQMTQSASSIVRATVTSSSASFTGSTIYTHYKLNVSETWKGVAEPEVMIPGGVANGLRQTFPGLPQLQIGSEYVLFLWKSTAGVIHVLGFSQGVFNVSQGSTGIMQLTRPAIGETLLDANGRSVQDAGMQLTMPAMRFQVRKAIAAQVNE